MDIFHTVKYTPQWVWLYEEFKKVDREETPWLIVLMHVPIYNSNEAHYMEGESMRAEFESWFVHYKVDVVFAGHVHAYERSVWFSPLYFHVVLHYMKWCGLFNFMVFRFQLFFGVCPSL